MPGLNILGRTEIAILTNQTGGTLAQGDIVVLDVAHAASFVTTTTSGYNTTRVGVVYDAAIAIGANGRIALSGYVPVINLSFSAVLGDRVKTHTVAKQGAKGSSSNAAPTAYAAGDFAEVLGTGTTPAAYLLGIPVQQGGGAGTDTTAIHTNVANEISGLTAKTTPVTGDVMVIEDSAAGFVKKKVDMSKVGGGGGGGGLVLIGSQSPTGTGTVTFSSIPGTYKNLRLEVVARSDNNSNYVSLNIQFNSDTTAGNYRYSYAFAYGATNVGGAGGATYSLPDHINALTAPSNEPSYFRGDILGYADTTFYKQMRYHSTNRRDATTVYEIVQVGGLDWQNTAAITSITVALSAGNFVAGSKVNLYGETDVTNGSAGGLVLLQEVNIASAQATADLANWYSATYDDYVIELVNVLPATNSVSLWIRASTNGGSTYDSSNLYAYSNFRMASAGTGSDGATIGSPTSQIALGAGQWSNSGNYGLNGSIKLLGPGSAVYKQFVSNIGGMAGGTDMLAVTGSAVYQNTTAVNAVRFLFSSGNIASGIIRIYGVIKSAPAAQLIAPVIYPVLTAPVSANFSWLNPGSMTVTNTDALNRLILTESGSNGAAFMQTAALPSAPYTIDLGYMVAVGTGAANLVAIALKNSGGAALRTYGPRSDSGANWYLNDQSWTAANSPGAQNNTLVVPTFGANSLVFLRITDDAVNRKIWWSNNGKDYILWLSQASGTGLSPDRAGILVYDTYGQPMIVTVYHWLISSAILSQFAT